MRLSPNTETIQIYLDKLSIYFILQIWIGLFSLLLLTSILDGAHTTSVPMHQWHHLEERRVDWAWQRLCNNQPSRAWIRAVVRGEES